MRKILLKRHAVPHGRSMKDDVQEILRDAAKNENRKVAGLGTRLARRFAGRGLDFEISEIRGERVRLVSFEE